MATYMRPRKDGTGYSECSSPDNLVGRGRCVHVLTDSNPLEIKKVSRGMYEVTIDDDKMTIQAGKQAIVRFFSSMPKLDDEKQKKIIDFLENEG